MSHVRHPALLSALLHACAMSAVAVLLSGCFATSEGRRPFYDHAYYAPAHGEARDIFLDPVGTLDRTIPNRLGSLTVRPAQISFETDRAARARSQLAPPAFRPTPPAAPAPAPKVTPNAAPAPQDAAKPIRYRTPARQTAPGINAAAQQPATDPVVGVIPRQADPREALMQQALPVTTPKQ